MWNVITNFICHNGYAMYLGFILAYYKIYAFGDSRFWIISIPTILLVVLAKHTAAIEAITYHPH